MYSPYFPICALWSAEAWLAIAPSEDCRRVKHEWGDGGTYFAQNSSFCISPSPQPACGRSPPLKAPTFLPEACKLFQAANGVQVICLILHVWLSTCIFCSHSRVRGECWSLDDALYEVEAAAWPSSWAEQHWGWQCEPWGRHTQGYWHTQAVRPESTQGC